MKTVLITDSQTDLGLRLVNLCLADKYQVISAFTDNLGSKATTPLKKHGLVPIKWNRPSRLSAKNLIFKIKNSFSSLDAAFMLSFPPPRDHDFQSINPLYLEEFLDKHIKGTLFLIQELLNYFAKQGRGWLTLIYLKPPELPPFLRLYQEALLDLVKYLGKLQAFACLNINAIKISEKEPIPNDSSQASQLLKIYQEKCNKSSGKVFNL